MRILVLDLSSSTGWAWLRGTPGDAENVQVLSKGRTALNCPIDAYGKGPLEGRYPWNYQHAAELLADLIIDQAIYSNPITLEESGGVDKFVIEEINLGKSRYAQKFLDFLHYAILKKLALDQRNPDHVVYIDSGAWRKAIKLTMTKEQKKANASLSKAKREAAAVGGKVDKAALGVKGKVTKKHLAIDYANKRFGFDLKMKDDDVADAVCIGCAFFAGADQCDGH